MRYMFLNEILQLDKTISSIRKIDQFLAQCDKTSKDYYMAFAYRTLVLHAIGKTNEALKLLYTQISNLQILPDEGILALCDAIIEITMDVGRLDQTKKYMEIKRRYLPVSQSHRYTKDCIRLAYASKEYQQAIRLIESFLKDDLPKEDEIWAREQLSTIYLEGHQYDLFLESILPLQDYYQDTLNMNQLAKIEVSKIKVFYEQGNYIRLIGDANRFLNEHAASMAMKVDVATLLIRSYLISKDYRKAAIIESNFEEEIMQVPTEIALEFAKAALELYTKTNSLVSIKQYQTLLQTLEQTKKNSKKAVKRHPKEIVIPHIKEEESESLFSVPILERVVLPAKMPTVVQEEVQPTKTVYISKAYDQLANLFKSIHSLSFDVPFREVYRMCGVALSAFVPIEEMYLLYFNRKYIGIHYKKERAYDKYPSFEEMDDTINFLALANDQEIYLDETVSTGLKNIVTKQSYESVPYGVAFPLSKEDVAFASVAFFSEKPFLQEEMAYEVLKLVAQMLNSRLLIEIKQKEFEFSNKRMVFIYEHMSSGVKEMQEDRIHLSKQAADLLGCMEDLSDSDFEAHIHASDLPLYREIKKKAYQTMEAQTEGIYRFLKHGKWIHIKETFFPTFEDGNLILYSLLDDKTLYLEKEQALKDLAFTNPISKLESELKLMMDVKHLLSVEKFSLVLLDVQDFSLYEELYGINFSNQLIYALASSLKAVFAEEMLVSVYHLESDYFALIFKQINDKRQIDAVLKKKFLQVSTDLKTLNRRLNIYFNAGVFRLAKNTAIDVEKVLLYATDALSLAKEEKTFAHHICHYDSEQAKFRFNEKQLITHISESIDHGKIGLSYQQVVRTKTNEIFAYYAHLSLDNYEVDPTYMKQVIHRRSLEKMMDRYTIQTASKELKMLNEAIKANVHVLIRLDEKTLTKDFLSFIEEQNRFFKTTQKGLILIVPNAQNPWVVSLKNAGYRIASYDLMDLYQKAIDYLLIDVSVSGWQVIDRILPFVAEQGAELIVEGIDTKEDLNAASTRKIPYIFGKYYKKAIRMKRVIEKYQKQA